MQSHIISRVRDDVLYLYMNSLPRLCISPQLLEEAVQKQQALLDLGLPYRYVVISSLAPGVFNLGGDLSYFVHCIEQRDEKALRWYAHRCIDCVWQLVEMGRQSTTISVLEGNALGGGLEGALPANIVMAGKKVRLGFPENRFNLFPGMGAYHFVGSKVSTDFAQHMIDTGRLYSGQALHQKGLVDVLLEPGDAHAQVAQLIEQHRANPSDPRWQSIQRFHSSELLSRDSLMETVDHWVECAFKIDVESFAQMKKVLDYQRKVLGKKRLLLAGGYWYKRARAELRFAQSHLELPFDMKQLPRFASAN